MDMVCSVSKNRRKSRKNERIMRISDAFIIVDNFVDNFVAFGYKRKKSVFCGQKGIPNRLSGKEGMARRTGILRKNKENSTSLAARRRTACKNERGEGETEGICFWS